MATRATPIPIDPHIAASSATTRIVIRPRIQKSVADAYLCAFPLGLLGLHRFYLGQPLLGLAYFFSFGIFGLGWLYDMLLMPKIVERANRRLANPQNPKQFSLVEAYALCLNPAGLLFGLHQFYLGRKKFGTAYCFTLGFFGIGWLIDIFRLPLLVADARRRQHELEISPEEAANKKRPKRLDDAYILWVFGFLGVHHFYLGNVGFGVAYLLTLGMGGIGWLIDFFRMPVLVKRANADPKSPFKHLDSAYVLTFPLGVLGLQHFYLGKPGLGVAYLLTFGLVGIGFLADLIRMPFLVREINQSILESERLLAVTVEDENTTNENVDPNFNATNYYQSPLPPTDGPINQLKTSLIPESSANGSAVGAAAAAPLPPPPPSDRKAYDPPPAYQSIVHDSAPEIPQSK